jgi:hypothetical protein
MVDDPKNIREVNLTVESLRRELSSVIAATKDMVIGLGASVDKRFDGVDSRFKSVGGRVYWVIGLLVGGFIGGISLHVDVAKVATKLDDVAEIVKGNTSKIEALQTINTNLIAGQQRIERIVARIESKVDTQNSGISQTPFTALEINDEERQTISKFFAVEKKGGPAFQIKLGEAAPSSVPLFPIPDKLVTLVPKLAGYRYFGDYSNGTVVIVRADGLVAAVV